MKQFSWILFPVVEIILCRLIFKRFDKIQKLFSRFWFSVQSQLGFAKVWEEAENHDSESSNQKHGFSKKTEDRNLCKEDLEMVMANLGFFCSPESEKLKDSIGSDELSQLFDEKEPSLDEVKEAFNVFDENRDGFIDANELQRVLYKLGLKEGIEVESCRQMIKAFDESGDGRIDFNEFVKFMENSFC